MPEIAAFTFLSFSFSLYLVRSFALFVSLSRRRRVPLSSLPRENTRKSFRFARRSLCGTRCDEGYLTFHRGEHSRACGRSWGRNSRITNASVRRREFILRSRLRRVICRREIDRESLRKSVVKEQCRWLALRTSIYEDAILII